MSRAGTRRDLIVVAINPITRAAFLTAKVYRLDVQRLANTYAKAVARQRGFGPGKVDRDVPGWNLTQLWGAF